MSSTKKIKNYKYKFNLIIVILNFEKILIRNRVGELLLSFKNHKYISINLKKLH
jgi:hypothetical protein